MLVNRLDIFLVQISYLCLTQPNIFLFKTALDACFSILSLVQDEIRCWGCLAGVSHGDVSTPLGL